MTNFENLSSDERHAAAIKAFMGDLDARGTGHVFLPAIDGEGPSAAQETGAIIPDDLWAASIRTEVLGLPRVTDAYVVELGGQVLNGTVQRSDR